METFVISNELDNGTALENHFYHLGIRDEEAELKELARLDKLAGFPDELEDKKEE